MKNEKFPPKADQPRAEKIKNKGQAPRPCSGQVMLTVVILFLFLSLTVVTGLSDPILRQATITRDFLNSRKSYFLAEAGVEDLTYRVKNNKQVPSNGTLALDGGSVNLSVSSVSNSKTISASASNSSLVRKVETVLKVGTGSSFNYGIQVGAGGLTLGNNATINGSVYSNGVITGANGVAITGSAFSANSAALTADQINDSPIPPPSSIIFGDYNSRQDFAESFKVSSNSPLTKVSLYIRKVGTPDNLTVRIVADNSGQPSGNTLLSATLDKNLIALGGGFAWIDLSFGSSIQLVPGLTYWLVLDNSGSNTSKYYVLGANTLYANGTGMVGQYGGSWSATSPAGLDGYFRIYLGGLTGLIDTVKVGTGVVGNAEAYQVKNSTIAGSLYCQVGSGNNKSCDASKPPPTQIDFPVSDSNVAQWQTDALAGGVINGDYTVSSSVSLGPKKIVGNLTINNKKILTLSGTVWVTGNITINNGGQVKLSSSYGANGGILLADGRIISSNNSSFTGSGQTGSYIMALTTSDCPTSSSCDGNYAIDISNNSGTVILNAQKGTIHMSNNAGAKELTAYKILVDNNSVVTYESGMANVNFTSGPTGGWNIQSWKEVE